MASVRQQKLARLIQRELGEYFRKEARNIAPGSMITVTVVRMTPDLGLAKSYLSIFGNANKEELILKIREMSPLIRRELGNLIKNQVRRVPELYFYIDDSLDYANEIEELLKK